MTGGAKVGRAPEVVEGLTPPHVLDEGVVFGRGGQRRLARTPGIDRHPFAHVLSVEGGQTRRVLLAERRQAGVLHRPGQLLQLEGPALPHPAVEGA
ncbi:hypothetical protein D3C72_1419940 [compost metagenome]